MPYSSSSSGIYSIWIRIQNRIKDDCILRRGWGRPCLEDIPITSRDVRKSFSSSWETIGSFLKGQLGRSGLQHSQGCGGRLVSIFLHFPSVYIYIYIFTLFSFSFTNHLICSSSKRCNGLPRLYEDKLKWFGEVSSSIEEKGFFSVPDLLESKSFH